MDCLASLGKIKWPYDPPQNIVNLGQELHRCLQSEGPKELLAAIDRLTLGDFERLPFGNTSNAGVIGNRIPGVCALPGAMEQLIRRIEFEVKEALAAYATNPPQAQSAPRLQSKPQPEQPGCEIREKIGRRHGRCTNTTRRVHESAYSGENA
jgi:hypothetical protein